MAFGKGVELVRYLNQFDYLVIGFYFLVLVIIGLYLRSRASRSLEHYFLGGKQMPWWLLGITGMGNYIDMSGTMLIVSFLYLLGPRGLYVEFRGGAVLLLAFMMVYMAKWHRRSNCMTGAEWMVYRFGDAPMARAARMVAAVGVIIAMTALLAYLIKGAGMFLAIFMPFPPGVCALIMVAVTVIYTLSSGFYGVVYTDLLQGAIILIAVIVIMTLTISRIMGYEGNLGDLAVAVSGNPDWMSSVPSISTNMPKGYTEYEPLLMMAFFFLFRNVLFGIGSMGDPHYFAARNERECGLLNFFWTSLMTIRWPMMISFAILGIFLVHTQFPDQSVMDQAARLIKQHETARLFPEQVEAGDDVDLVKLSVPKPRWEALTSDIANNPERYPELVSELQQILGREQWQSKLELVHWEGMVNPERIVPAVLSMSIPDGLRGLFIIAFLAAAMSTFAPTLNMTTALFTRDMYQAYIRPLAGNRELILVSWGFGSCITLGGLILGIFYTDSIDHIWNWFIMGFGAALLIPNLLRLYWWRFNAFGYVVGGAVVMTVAILQRYLQITYGILDWGTINLFLILTGLSLVSTVIATLLSQPTDRPILEHFYRTTRPFGLWGPLKHVLSPAQAESTRREHRNDLLALPFALAWQITLFLLPMQLMIGAFRAFGITLVIFLVGLGGLYVFWYKNLPPDQEGVSDPGYVVRQAADK
ncbi:MAG: sodium:solute symporter [Phycisphaerales bacterium]|nr:sodium:solute symporter [Phycisphaerales bacterium]